MAAAETLRIIQLEGEVRDQHLASRQMRKYLAGALCCACGEPLGDDDGAIIMDDQERTIHERCEETETT